MKDQFIAINIKQKVKIKIRQINIDIFSNQIFLKLFVLVFTSQDVNSKRFDAPKYYLAKGIIINYNIIINGKNFYDQAIDSNIKRYEEIRKLTIGHGEDYTRGCLLDYDYIKNHCRLIEIDLSRQMEIDADPKAIQQIEFVEQLKKLDADDNAKDTGDNDQSLFILCSISVQSQGSVTVL